jgi:leucyl aminopeptidase
LIVTRPECKRFIERYKFKGKTGEDIVYNSAETGKLTVIAGAGTGSRDDGNTRNSIKLAKRVVEILQQHKIKTAVMHFVQELRLGKGFWRNLIDYLFIDNYRFDTYLKEKGKRIHTVNFCIEGVSPLNRSLIKEREVINRGVGRVRDLVNEIPSTANPDYIVEAFERTAERYNLDIAVSRGSELKTRGLAGVAAVGESSPFEPAMIRLSYVPGKFVKTAALVGKGITFDSGGLCLKTSVTMRDMKGDMAGAAAVLGVVEAAAKLRLPVRIDAFVPVAENMPGQYAFKPGDIITFNNDKTVEIVDTDAEGRLMLADALVMAAQQGPDYIIELSTLTGNIANALGDAMAGVMGNDEKLVYRLLASGKKTGEFLWQMPLPAEYKEAIKSKVANLKNAGYGRASAIKAGLFLAEFVEGIPFAHIDMAGTAFLSKSNAFYLPEGATGFGVRLLLDWLQSLCKEVCGGKKIQKKIDKK